MAADDYFYRSQLYLNYLQELETRDIVKLVLENKFPTNSNVPLGNTPELLKQMGADDLPIAIGITHLRDVCADFDDTLHQHGVDKEIVANITSKLENPLFVISSKQRADSLIFCIKDRAPGNDSLKSCPILVNVHLNGEGILYGKQQRMHFITSMYGKRYRGVHTLLQDAINDGNIWYLDRKALISEMRGWKTQSPSLSIWINGLADLPDKTIIGVPTPVENTKNMPEFYNARYMMPLPASMPVMHHRQTERVEEVEQDGSAQNVAVSLKAKRKVRQHSRDEMER